MDSSTQTKDGGMVTFEDFMKERADDDPNEIWEQIVDLLDLGDEVAAFLRRPVITGLHVLRANAARTVRAEAIAAAVQKRMGGAPSNVSSSPEVLPTSTSPMRPNNRHERGLQALQYMHLLEVKLRRTTFSLDGKRDRREWGQATVEEHMAGIAYRRQHLANQTAGAEQTIADHEQAITLIQERNVSCLDDVAALAKGA